ncbi:hypothetical protein TNCV_3108261 [Trichonephila clavipes]|uniref:Uncharacterized protein n=1 Tax=Trichonephila clavipes TaxID=2585209 RepID=A0A8X6SB97_TRICX|nr:hypothetical protein TNCV_3108261 [Trichonephila clavipes]
MYERLQTVYGDEVMSRKKWLVADGVSSVKEGNQSTLHQVLITTEDRHGLSEQSPMEVRAVNRYERASECYVSVIHEHLWTVLGD